MAASSGDRAGAAGAPPHPRILLPARSAGHAARLSTVGGFAAGSGRDTFITWNRGGRNKENHEPGKAWRTFENSLRGTVNLSRTPSERRRPRTVSGNPTGRFRPRPPRVVNDDRSPAYGKASIKPGQFSVSEMFSQMNVTPSAHSSLRRILERRGRCRPPYPAHEVLRVAGIP